MPTLEAGTVFVQVAPSFKGFQKAAAQAGVSGGETLAKAFEKTASQAKANLNGSVEGADEEGAKAAAEFQTAFQSGLKAAHARLPKVKIDADSSPADRKLAELRARMLALSDKQIGVDIDAGDAFLEMGLIEAELVNLSRSHPNIEVKADIVKAITELQAVAMAAEALDDKDVDIDVKADTSGLTGMGFAVQSTGALVGGLVAAIGLIGPAAVSATNVATGAIIAIGAAASGAAAAIGTAVLALAPIVGKTIAFRQVKSKKSAGGGNRGGGVSGDRGGGARQDTAKMDARRVANAQKQVAAARKASVKSTQAWAKRVRDAERNVAKVSAASAKQVAAAQKNLSRVRQQAATRVESANRAVVAAEKQLVAAQRGVEKAQRNLSKARRDAVKDLRDMQSAIKNGVLAERSAVLAVKLAKKNLEDLGKTGGTALEWEQARLNLDKANQALEDQKSANRDLAEEKARTDREGVEGTERVRVARQALVEAEERVQDAVEAVAEARENAARVAVDAAESVAGAEQRVVDARLQAIEEQEEALGRLKEARAAAQEAAEEAAEREQEAKERLAQTVEDIADRNRRMGAAATSAGVAGVAAAGAVADALEGLPESGKAFVLYLDRLIDKFGELSVTAQNGFLPGLMRGLQATEPLFKPLNALIDDLSRRLGRIAENGLKSLTDPGWQRFGQFLADNLGPAMDTTATIIANILAGIRDLVIALKPLGEYFLNAFEAGTAGFAEWAANLDSNQDFQNWIKGVMEEAPKVGELIGAIASALGNLWGAAMGGEGNMSTLDRMTGFFQKIADMDPGQIQTIANAVIGIGTAFAGLGGLAATGSMIGSIANGLKSVGSVLGLGGAAAGEGGAGLIGLVGNLGSKLAGLAGPIGIAVAVITTLFAAIKTLWDTNEGFRNAVSQAWEGIQATFQNAYDQVFKPVFEGLGELFGAAGNAFDSEFATVVNTLWNTVLGPLFDLVSTVVGTLFNQVLIPLFGAGATAFRDLVKNIKDSWDSSGKPLFDAISKVAKDVLEVTFGNVLRNVKKLFEDMVKGVKDVLGGLGKGFEAFGRFLKGDFTGAWRAAKDAIGRIWKGIRQVVAAPVNFVINVVYNNGLRAWFNKLAGVIGAPVRMPYRPPIRFASGGVLPGYTPGRDVHRFWSPTGGLLYLSGGEGIIRPDALRAMGGKKWSLSSFLCKWGLVCYIVGNLSG